MEPVVVVGRTCVGDFCHVPVTVEGVPCSALVDTGSTVTLVRPDIVPGWTQCEPTTVQLRTVTGELAPMKGKGIMTLTVGGRTVRHPVWVAAVQDPCILGLDFLRSTGCQLDLNRGTLSFQGGTEVTMAPPNVTFTQPNKPFTPTVKAAETHGCAPSPTAVCDFSPVPLSPTAVCYIPPATSMTQPSVSPGRIPPAQLPQMGEERTLSAVREIWGRNCVGLDPEQQERLWQLLFEFRDSFALSEEEVGQTHLVQHEIDTGDARPIKMRPRRIPLARQEAADKAVLEMQRADFIEPSDSPWAAPVVMVPKKGGKLRFCADYRRLNEVTRKDSYPIPRIDESLDLVRGSSWFSSLDLRSGYWQVPLSPEARAKTAFSTNRGHWQFKVLCFGLCNAPATFERLMDRVLDGIPRQQCLVYLDDILAHGSSFQSALGALRRVLERVAAAGLKLHPEKCHFMRREVSFLGHRVGKEGISTMEDKVGAVRDWPTPTDQRQLKSFLGLASYYRRFVRGFSSVAAPLNRLLPKDKAFTWTVECEEAFNTLKRALIEAPVLAPPDLTLPFILDTDASNVGMGGVLAQVGPEGERVVAYFSKTFDKHERRYCVTRRELLAVVASVKHFKYYLGGLPFTVRTDHSALQWLMSFREPEGQVARWLEELQPYDFTVVHRAGARHSNADAMSRRPCTADGCRHCERREGRERELRAEEGVCATVCRASGPVCCELQTVDVAEWRQQQGRDTDLQPVLQWVEAQVRPPWEEVTALSLATKGLWSKFERLRLADGVLQRAWKESATGEERWQVVVPKALREAVLQSTHGGVGTGHFGVTKTLRRLRQGFYWGQHKRDVEDFCRRCDNCTARKGPPGRSHAQLQQFPVGAPMERVGVDVVGPFPTTDSGNRWVLTAMDYFTKWPEAYALPDQEAETIVDALTAGMFSRFGAAESIHSDQGRNFESRVFATMCERLGMHKTRTTPLHPQSDGLVERFNKTLGQQLAIVSSKHQRDWDKHLPMVLMACRSAVQDSTSCTPALLMLGREIRTPAEMAFGRPLDSPHVPPGPEYARRLQDRLETAHTFAREQLVNAGVRQKRNYDVHTRGRHFVAGELVWVYSPLRKKGRCPKLDSHWVGPCSVLERVGEVVYRVQLPPRGRKVALHRDRLAPYRGASSPQTPGTPTIPLSGNDILQAPTLRCRRQGSRQPTPPVSPPVSPRGSPEPRTVLPVPASLSPISLPSSPGSQRGTLRPSRPRRQRRPPGRFRDFVCSLGDEGLCGGGAV